MTLKANMKYATAVHKQASSAKHWAGDKAIQWTLFLICQNIKNKAIMVSSAEIYS